MSMAKLVLGAVLAAISPALTVTAKFYTPSYFLWASMLALLLVIATWRWSADDTQRLVLIGAAPCVGMAGIQALFGGTERLIGTTDNVNVLASLLVVVAVTAWAAGWRWYAVLCAVLLILSGSRGGLLAGAAAALTLLALRRPRWRWAVLALIPLGVVLFALRGDTGRLGIWQHALDLFASNPLLGAGDFRYPDAWTGLLHVHAHNALLHMAATQGLLGVGITVFLAGGWWRVAHRLHQQGNPYMYVLLVGVGVQQTIDFTLYTTALMLFVWLAYSGLSFEEVEDEEIRFMADPGAGDLGGAVPDSRPGHGAAGGDWHAGETARPHPYTDSDAYR